MKTEIVSIGTWPTPEKPFTLKIPTKLLEEFGREARVVVRHPWVVGLPVSEMLLRKMLRNPRGYGGALRKFDLMLVPKENPR